MAIPIPERSEEDRATGTLRITVGNSGAKRLPTLPMKPAADWLDSLGPSIQAMLEAVGKDNLGAPRGQDLAELGQLPLRAMLDAVVSYDRTGALGGRTWLEENADPEQIYIAALQIGQVVFPFARSVEGLYQAAKRLGLLELLQKTFDQAGQSPTPSSTNGPSPTGDSILGPSAIDSTPSSSSTSGEPARRALVGSSASA